MPNQTEEIIVFSSEVKDQQGILYNFVLLMKNDLSCIKLSLLNKISIIHWECCFSLNSLSFVDKKWNYFENDREIHEIISKSINESIYSLKKTNENCYIFEFNVLKKEFSIVLTQEKGDFNEDLIHVVDLMQVMDEKIKKIENFNENVEGKLNKIDEIMKKLLKFSEIIENKITIFDNKMMQNYEELSSKIDISLKSLKIHKKILYKIYPESNIFLNNYNFSFVTTHNHDEYTFTHNNKTLQKTSGNKIDYYGFRCDPPKEIHENTLHFSLKIEELGNINCFIKFGWCTKNSDHFKGICATNSSFALYLYNGVFFNRSVGSIYAQNIRGSVGQIYTAILDVKEKNMRFFINGESFGGVKSLELKEEEIKDMCPFVDLINPGDKVSIVDNIFEND